MSVIYYQRFKTTAERFEEKYTPEPNSGCWLWTGGTSWNGYGLFNWGAGGERRAHRYSWKMYRGEIPVGLEVCHKCDVPCCVNPDHLFLGTHSENMVDSFRKGRKRLPSRFKHGRYAGDTLKRRSDLRYARNYHGA